MKAKISARGYTNVILVLNMKRFIAAEDQRRFETIRGTPQFAEVLRNGWWNSKNKKTPFTRNVNEARQDQAENNMSTEQVGFATGVFRSLFLEEHVVPTYLLRKEKVTFPKDLVDNFQFRNLFLDAWKTWKIYIRPTVTGMFIIRLTREYNKPRELVKIAEDVLKLNESLDVQSARAWLIKKREELKDQPNELKKVQGSVSAFLKWLGSKASDKGELLYNPVQWKIAMEVASLFVKATGEIPVPGSEPLHLSKPEPRLSIPLHDSYVVYHIDDIFADETIVIKEEKSNKPQPRGNNSKSKGNHPPQLLVTPEALNHSPLIKRALINLLEGAILERSVDAENNNTENKNISLNFPAQRWQVIDQIMERNLASWMGEISLLTSRTALLIPSGKYKKDNLLVSTTPGATLKVKYARYWGAIERMIEFGMEIRTLAQLVERASYESLEQTAQTVDTARKSLQAGDIELDSHLPQHVSSAGNLRRLAALSQGMSDPLVWSRSEYAIVKAQYLLEQLGVPTLLTHIDRNMTSLNGLVDHIDELYALDLAEKNNDLSAVMTLGLTAVSFILTLIMLPSFWTDLQQIDTSDPILGTMFSTRLLNAIGYSGTFVGLALITFSLVIGYNSIKHIGQIWNVIKRALKRMGR
ncbi:MAG: hypothetical protein QY302_03925 [Anaerolineales bacterium]|nr:MAG: hypothetical protein QY302_03925 [Anaerolineales bacterium]